jgi:L,D-transpeptidase catalytic domain
MAYRAAAAVLLVLTVLLAGYFFRPLPKPVVAPVSRNDAQLPEVELTEPEPAPILSEGLDLPLPMGLTDAPEPLAAPLPNSVLDDDLVLPAHGLIPVRPKKGSRLPDRRPLQLYEPAAPHQPVAPNAPSAPVLYAEGDADMSLRNVDFPNTYISHIEIDLTSPSHYVRLAWTGPQAARQRTGPFHSSPGAGTGFNDCDDMDECNRENSNCTPKGEFTVEAFSDYMKSYPNCRYVTWFLASRGIAMHSHNQVPNYPASHGCVRLAESAAQLIHNNSLIGKTKVTVGGTWTRLGSF